MIIKNEIGIAGFDAWSGARDTKSRIIEEGMEEEFDAMMEELYPEGMTETQLNDILWFESDWIYSTLGIEEGDEDED